MCCPPTVANGRAPCGYVFPTTIAERVEDGVASLIEGISHLCIALLTRLVLIVAVIVFEIVHVPFRVSIGINLFIAKGTRAARASLGSRIAVQTKLEAFRVDIVDHALKVRKCVRIGNDDFVGIPALSPTVVDVDVLVA